MTEEEVKALIAKATDKFTTELNQLKEYNKKLTNSVAEKDNKINELNNTITDLMVNGKSSNNEAEKKAEEKTPEELFLAHTDNFIKERYAKRKEVNN